MPTPMKLNSHYYQQFDADLSLDVPGEGYGGWKQAELTYNRDRMALVVMHAWDSGTPEEVPGLYRAEEYLPRAMQIGKTVFPPLLKAARETGLRVYHVVSGGEKYKAMPGFKRAQSLAKSREALKWRTADDELINAVYRFRHEEVSIGKHNKADADRRFKTIEYMPESLPVGDEGIAEDSPQLFGLCKADGVNHLVYIGFAINWCLLTSPGGMHEMSQHGIMCSTIRQAVTALESKESARRELFKEIALWRTALSYGFVFDYHEFIRAARASAK